MPAATPLDKAAAACALYEYDGNASRVAAQLGMPRPTVNDIVHGYGRWAEIGADASFIALRQEQKAIFQAASAKIMSQALVQMENKLPLCSAPQAAMVYGIVFDKARLLSGDSTVNVAIRTNEVSNLDQIAEALRNTLLARKQKA